MKQTNGKLENYILPSDLANFEMSKFAGLNLIEEPKSMNIFQQYLHIFFIIQYLYLLLGAKQDHIDAVDMEMIRE